MITKYGKKIREIREKNKDTLEELADKLNMSWSSLGKFERGERKITPDLLERIADLYDVPIVYFFGEDEKELPDELKELGEGWVSFAEEMEEKSITPEEIKAVMRLFKKQNE
ncbi:helix-turn-helix domain-containing protein [Peribacillus muralis]|uniref:helix-turn-helix domain-containing protein n=1 Tax=Peribacillus muralis TaxID=264697 RepID=UPI003D08D1A0